jgi:hypothetical protein
MATTNSPTPRRRLRRAAIEVAGEWADREAKGLLLDSAALADS